MGDFAAIIENAVVDNILANGKILPQASRANKALITFATGCFLAGILLMVYAIYLWVLVAHGQLIAVVCASVVLLILAALCSGGLVFYRRKKIAEVNKEMIETVRTAFQLVKDDVGDVVENNPKAIIAAACLAGFVAGKRFL